MTSTRRIYFVDHNTRTTTWDDPRLPVNGRGRRRRAAVLSAEDRLLPELPLIANAKCDVCVHRRWDFEDSFFGTMRLLPGDLRKRLTGKFEGEDAVDYGGVSRERFFLSHEMFNRATACSSLLRTDQPGLERDPGVPRLQVHRPRSRPHRNPTSVPQCILCTGFL